MPRLLAHLVALLFVVAFAAPAMAHVHGEAAGGVVAMAQSRAPALAEASATPGDVAAVTVGAPAPCDRDCDHRDGIGACACMAACLALTVAEAPGAARLVPAAVARPGEAHRLRGAMPPPPVPPPRT